jgi:hypothetical protein
LNGGCLPSRYFALIERPSSTTDGQPAYPRSARDN